VYSCGRRPTKEPQCLRCYFIGWLFHIFRSIPSSQVCLRSCRAVHRSSGSQRSMQFMKSRNSSRLCPQYSLVLVSSVMALIDGWAFHLPEGHISLIASSGNDVIRMRPYRSHKKGATCAGSVGGMSMVVLLVGIQAHAYDNGGCGSLPCRARRKDVWPRSSPITSQVSIGPAYRNRGRPYQARSVPDVCRMRPSSLHQHFRSLVNPGLYVHIHVGMVCINTGFSEVAENGRAVCVVVWAPKRS
jgi:hypothetical protein